MSWSIFLWVLAYAFLGLVVLSIAVGVLTNAVQGMRPKETYTATITVQSGTFEDPVEVKVVARDKDAIRALVHEWAPMAVRPRQIRADGER